MLQIISNLIRNQKLQDSASIARGLYRIRYGAQDQCSLFRQSLLNEDSPFPEQKITQIFPFVEEKTINQDNMKNQVNIENQENIENEASREQIQQPTKSTINFIENTVPETAWQRAFQFGVLGARLAGGTAKSMIISGGSLKESALSESNADLLSRSLCKMRGAPLKIAQALSIQEDKLIPENVRNAFEKARQNADVMPRKQLEKMMTSELGVGWVKEFQEFQFEPFAAASIGQVHKGVVNGLEVAVKVQYPGVRDSIDSDISNLRRIMKYSNILPKTMFMDELLHNSKIELIQECDYRTEAIKQIRYLQMLKQYDNKYTVPSVISHLSTQRILTAEYLAGVDLTQVANNFPQHVRNDIGSRIMELTLRELFQFRFMQTDPNPANFSYSSKKDKLILFDFGAAREYSKEFIDKYIDIIYGAATLNRDLCLQRSIELGFLRGDEPLRMKDAHVESVLAVGEPFSQEGPFDFGSQVITNKVYELMPVMLRHRVKAPPSEVYSLHRKLSGFMILPHKHEFKELSKLQVNLYGVI